MDLASGVASKGSVVKRSQQPVVTERTSPKQRCPPAALESAEAGSQLLSAAPPREGGERGAREAPVPADARLLVTDAPSVSETPVVKSGAQPEVSMGTAERDSPGLDVLPPAEGTSTSTSLPAPKRPPG